VDCGAYLVFGGARIQDERVEPDRMEDAETSIAYTVSRLRPSHLAVNLLRLLPGTPFAREWVYRALWPDGKAVTGGSYDRRWLAKHGVEDRRAVEEQPLVSLFQAVGSVLPAHVDEERCVRLLQIVMDGVKRARDNGDKIVTDFNWNEAQAVIARRTGEHHDGAQGARTEGVG
jgi:hypothetical protein